MCGEFNIQCFRYSCQYERSTGGHAQKLTVLVNGGHIRGSPFGDEKPLQIFVRSILTNKTEVHFANPSCTVGEFKTQVAMKSGSISIGKRFVTRFVLVPFFFQTKLRAKNQFWHLVMMNTTLVCTWCFLLNFPLFVLIVPEQRGSCVPKLRPIAGVISNLSVFRAVW